MVLSPVLIRSHQVFIRHNSWLLGTDLFIRHAFATNLTKLWDSPAAVFSGYKLIRFRCISLEWHYRKIGFTSSCCHFFFIPCCVQIKLWQQCVTVSTDTAIYLEHLSYQLYAFYSVYSILLCIFVRKPDFSLQGYFPIPYFQLNWGYENKQQLTSLQKDFGMRHGGSQDPLSTGGFTGGQPPAGHMTIKSNKEHDVFKEVQRWEHKQRHYLWCRAFCCSDNRVNLSKKESFYLKRLLICYLFLNKDEICNQYCCFWNYFKWTTVCYCAEWIAISSHRPPASLLIERNHQCFTFNFCIFNLLHKTAFSDLDLEIQSCSKLSVSR